jgi:hypothetical protein
MVCSSDDDWFEQRGFTRVEFAGRMAVDLEQWVRQLRWCASSTRTPSPKSFDEHRHESRTKRLECGHRGRCVGTEFCKRCGSVRHRTDCRNPSTALAEFGPGEYNLRIVLI